MRTYQIVFVSIDDPTQTRSYTVTDRDDRWALGKANDLVLIDAPDHAWNLQSVTDITDGSDNPVDADDEPEADQ